MVLQALAQLNGINVISYYAPYVFEQAGWRGHDAILMANHGAVAYGPDLMTAFHRMEAVEQIARVTLVTEVLGKQNLLSSSETAELIARRARSGVGPPATGNPQPLITSDSNETERVSCCGTNVTSTVALSELLSGNISAVIL